MHSGTDTMDERVSEKELTGSMASSEKLSLTDPNQSQKRRRIQEACHQQQVETLVELASSTGGLCSDDLRQLACTLPSFRQFDQCNFRGTRS